METRNTSRRSTRLLALILIIALLVTPFSALSQSDINATGAYMLDATTGEELFAKNEDTKLVPASLTKLMTVYLVYEAMEEGMFTEDSIVPISQEVSDFSRNSVYSNVPLYTWQNYTVSQLLDAVIISSACAATDALGLMVCPTKQEFVALMNATAQEMGIDCSYADLYGGSSESRVTAKGVAVLCYNLLKEHPGYLDHSQKPYYYINGKCYYTTNRFISGYYSCNGTVDGIKTGTTSAAGYCFSITAYSDDLRVIAVVLKSGSEYYRNTDGKALMNYGLGVLTERKNQGWLYADPGSMTVTVGANSYVLPTYYVDGTTYVCPGDLALMASGTSAAFGYEITEDRLQLTRGGSHTGAMTEQGTKTVMAPPTGKAVCLGDTPTEFPSYQLSGNAYVSLEALLALLEISAEVSMDGSSMVIHVADRVEPFVDVFENAWYADAVVYVRDRGIMQGHGDGTFTPEAELTRAMMAQILYNLTGHPEIEQPTEDSAIPAFEDVAPGSWYENAVLWAASVGIVNGRSPSIFDPEASITREEMVAMIYRYENYLGSDTSARDDLEQFVDRDSIEPYARDAVEWAVAAGVIHGTSHVTLEPASTATRAQVATIMMNSGY